jgi:putative LysE/RhtB family amino acid efflux pump
MPPPLALLARTFVIGVAVAAPVGAMGVLCIQRTLARGWRAGVATGLGIATADGIYAGLAAFGVAAVAATIVAYQAPLRIGGGLVLMWLGVRALRSPPTSETVTAPDSAKLSALYFGAVGLTLTNPLTIMAFAAIFAGAGLVAQPGLSTAAVATLGVASGSLAWWIALSTGTALARHAAGERTLLWVNRVSGGVIAAFGVVAIVAGVLALR